MQRLRRLGMNDEAERLHETGRVVNNLGEDVLAVDETTMRDMLAQAGLHLIELRGVRVQSDEDYRTLAEVAPAQLRAIIAAEIRNSIDPKVKHLGQMVHYICRRSDSKKQEGTKDEV
jgi:hypothetical protein